MDISVRQVARDGYIGAILLSNASYHRITGEPESGNQTVKSGQGSILIVGGELFNKGAQAMTYTVVSQISDRYPEKDIYLMSTQDFERPAEERARYTFEILPWSPDIRLSYLRGGELLEQNIDYSDEVLEDISRAVSTADCTIDINGYALSSQRGTRRSLLYLLNIMIARRRGIPFHIFPQSIGPFDYEFPESVPMQFLLGTYLPYPAQIYPREESGVTDVGQYRETNLHQELDLVLTHDYEVGNIFRNPPNPEIPTVPDHSVGIVPNMRVAERISEEQFRSLYTDIIETLQELDRHPVVIQHSIEDEPLCETIAEVAGDEVTVITGDRQPFELEAVINQLNFLIGSRYHSIVHAYKQNVPAIVIGWAEKYQVLLSKFHQEDSVFDVRGGTDTEQLLEIIKRYHEGYEDRMKTLNDQKEELISDRSIFETI